MQFDLVIIGTGTAAMVTATRVRDAGWSVAVIDEKPFGGTCALRGRRAPTLGAAWIRQWHKRLKA